MTPCAVEPLARKRYILLTPGLVENDVVCGFRFQPLCLSGYRAEHKSRGDQKRSHFSRLLHHLFGMVGH